MTSVHQTSFLSVHSPSHSTPVPVKSIKVAKSKGINRTWVDRTKALGATTLILFLKPEMENKEKFNCKVTRILRIYGNESEIINPSKNHFRTVAPPQQTLARAWTRPKIRNKKLRLLHLKQRFRQPKPKGKSWTRMLNEIRVGGPTQKI